MSARTEDWLPRHRLNVDEYYRMGETGVLAPEARTELIDGEIIDMVPPGSRHAGVVAFLSREFSAATIDSAYVFAQSPLRISRFTEPQPDLMLLRPRDDFYTRSHPTPADVLLAIEVSESSLRYDRQIKSPLYAAHGIAQFWLIDLAGKELHLCRDARDGSYGNVSLLRAGELASVTTMSGVTVNLSRLFEF